MSWPPYVADWVPLPYRVRARLRTARLKHGLQTLARTRPLPARTGAAAAELFIPLCRRDLWIGILAVKSLLRYADERLAVTVLDDESLGPADQALIHSHVPGVRFLAASHVPDVGADPLAGRPRLIELRDTQFVFFPKLVFPRAYARAPKVILLDADTVFFGRPHQLLDWITTGSGARYLTDYRRDDRDEAPAAVKARWHAFERDVMGGRLRKMPGYYFNAGFLAYEPRALDFGIAEHFLEWDRSCPAELRTGTPGIWFGQWTKEQSAYMLMFSYLDPPALPFGREYHIEDAEGALFCHFLQSGLARRDTLRRLQQVIAELP